MPKKLDNFEEVVLRFHAGLSMSEIAIDIGKSSAYVSKRLRRLGLSRTLKEIHAIKMARKPFSTDAAIVARYVAGEDAATIARSLGHSHSYILRHVRAAGVVRTRGAALRLRAAMMEPNVRVGSHGYYVVSREGRDKLMHRMVMERLVGRRLGRLEVVHHRNHNKLDNSPGNLELLSPSDHIRCHRLDGVKCLLCEHVASTRFLCGKHYQRMRKKNLLAHFPLTTNRLPTNCSAAANGI